MPKFDGQYTPVDAQVPFQGLYTSLPGNRLAGSFSPDLNNVYIRDGEVRRRAGYLQLGQALVGEVLAIVEPNLIDKSTGAFINPMLVLTNRRQYKYDDATNLFVDITPDQVDHAITAVNTSTKTFTIAGDQTANLPVGRPIPVENSTGNDGVYTVVSATFTTSTAIVVSETIPDATVDGEIVLADDWTLTPTDGYIDYAVATDLTSSRIIITNGVERPRQWDGADNFEDWFPTYTSFQTCKTLAVQNDALFMGGIVAQTHEPSLIAWSDISEFDEFEAGTSGVQILTGVVKEIRKLEGFGRSPGNLLERLYHYWCVYWTTSSVWFRDSNPCGY